MSMTKGYVFHLTPDRMKAFRECREDGRYRFGEPVPNFSHNRYAPLICFLVNEGKIIHITIGSRGRQNQAGSGLSPLKLDRSEPLKTPIPLDQLLENVPKKNKSYLGKRVASGGLLNQAAEDDRKHMIVQGVEHLMLFVSDEASAHSTNWKELRNLPKDDPTLIAKARRPLVRTPLRFAAAECRPAAGDRGGTHCLCGGMNCNSRGRSYRKYGRCSRCECEVRL